MPAIVSYCRGLAPTKAKFPPVNNPLRWTNFYLKYRILIFLGIFKIEDSVEVARLWGIRKNRPAMNYDKLSRSIRQYYKKGIIKKTEVSQRLVYQFVKPIV